MVFNRVALFDRNNQVVSRERLPTFEDRLKLRYIDFIIQVVLRWCPVSPVGISHRSLKDDTYEGYLIPAGSLIFANAQAMTRDERIYSSPDEFDPDRYMPVEEGGLPSRKLGVRTEFLCREAPGQGERVDSGGMSAEHDEL